MPWLLFGLVTAGNLAGLCFRIALASDPAVTGPVELGILRAMPSFEIAALVGTLVLRRRPRHGAGLAMMIIAGAFAALMLTEGYAHYVLLADRDWPLAIAAAWAAHWLWIPVFAGLGLLVLVLPDGELPSPRWVPVRWGILGGGLALSVAFALTPGPLDEVYPPTVINPLGASGAAASVVSVLGAVAGPVMLVSICIGVVSLIVRYRRADAVRREQLRWVALGGALAGTFTVLQATIGQDPAIEPITETGSDLSYAAFFLAIGVAILRHRLFDINLVLNRAIVYAIVAVFITIAYVSIVVGIGTLVDAGPQTSLGLSLVTTVAVAIAFAPVRDWARRRANRWIYGERQAPYELLRDFGARLGGTVSPEELLPSIARSAADGVGALAAEVRLDLPDGRQKVARWGAPDDTSDGYLAAVVRADQRLGQITAVPRPGFPFTARERRLINDLARQSSLALANLQLTTALADQLETVSDQARELRASRQRLVAAQDQERRRLERDLHDGAQQQLVAVTLGLRAVADQVPSSVAPLVEAVREQVSETLATLRELARGVFPPLLAQAGLAVAIRGQVAKTHRPALVEDLLGGTRFDRAAEAALYFCCLEAVQNATKHAGDRATITIRMERLADEVVLTVSDDGAGFRDDAPRGSGLTNLADRLAAVGGRLRISSQSGVGTTVECVVPVADGLESATQTTVTSANSSTRATRPSAGRSPSDVEGLRPGGSGAPGEH